VTGEYLSEDFGFCELWRQLGGKIWLDVEGALVIPARTTSSAIRHSVMERAKLRR